MTKEEFLCKSVEFLRPFAKQVKTLSEAEMTPLEFRDGVRALIRFYEIQWPNWLDEDIEDVSEEKEDMPEDMDKADRGDAGTCACGASGTWMFDPYDIHINDQLKPVCLCEDCAQERLEDI
jgi:hypothetical protein